MRSYLSIIAARVVHQPQSIRPRVGSSYESPGPRMRILEPIAKRQIVQSRRASESGNEQAEPPSVAENIVEYEKTARASRADIRPAAFEAAGRVASLQPEIKPVAPQPPSPPIRVSSGQPELDSALTGGKHRVETSDHKDDRSRPGAIRSESAHTEPPAIEIIEKTNVIESAPAPAPAEPGPMTTSKLRFEPSFHAGIVVRPKLVGSEGKTPTFEVPLSSQEAPQSIRITIGRVDVRAIMPQPANATNEVRKAATAGPMSLDEYLKKRNGP